MDIIFDIPTPDEFKFILDSWSNSFRKSPWAGCVPNNLWPDVSRVTSTQLITRSLCKTTVALSPAPDGERGRVMGYSVAEPGILHWLYVKKDFRKLGIGNSILNYTTNTWNNTQRKFPRYTHKTNACLGFFSPGWKWDPVQARIKV